MKKTIIGIVVIIVIFLYSPWITRDYAETVALERFVRDNKDGIDVIYSGNEPQKTILWTNVNIYYTSKYTTYEYGNSIPNSKDTIYVAKYYIDSFGNIVNGGTEKTRWNDSSFPEFLIGNTYYRVNPN